MEEYKEDSNMITFEVTDNMLAKVSLDFLTFCGPPVNQTHPFMG